MLSVNLSQWTALRCHQYRRQRTIATASASDIVDGDTQNDTAISGDNTFRSHNLLDDGPMTERMSLRQLRREIEHARDYLERCGGLTQEEEWPQV